MSNILNYWVGQAPLNPVGIQVRDSAGLKDCSSYDGFAVQLIGSDNEIIELSQAELTTAGARNGQFNLTWPRKSVFTKPGVYVLQLILTTVDGYRDMTSAAEIRVRDPRGGNR